MKEAFPQISRIAIVWHGLSNPSTASILNESGAAAAALGLSILSLELRSAADIDGTFATISQQRAGGTVIVQDGFTYSQLNRIIALVTKSRQPSIYESRDWTDTGGLIAYGPVDSELYQRSAYFVEKILKGAKPVDLPVEQPTKFELVINAKAAKAFGLTIPQSLLLRADHVIE